MQKNDQRESVSPYFEILENIAIPQKSMNPLPKIEDLSLGFQSEVIKKSLLNIFLEVEKKNKSSINDSNKTQLFGVIIGEASRKKYLYERFDNCFEKLDTKHLTNIISGLLINSRNRTSLLGTEKKEAIDLGKFKMIILSFGDYFSSIIYQGEKVPTGIVHLEEEIRRNFSKINYLNSSIIQNNVLGNIDKSVGVLLGDLPDTKSLIEIGIKLMFMILFTAVTLNKVYEWNLQKIIEKDPILSGLKIEVDRSLFLNSYAITGVVPETGYKSYLRSLIRKKDIKNVRWNLSYKRTMNLETVEMRVQVLIKKLNELPGYKLWKEIDSNGLVITGFTESANNFAEINEYLKRFKIGTFVKNTVKADYKQF